MRVNMYDKRFVGSMLSIIGEQCPDVRLSLSDMITLPVVQLGFLLEIFPVGWSEYFVMFISKYCASPLNLNIHLRSLALCAAAI